MPALVSHCVVISKHENHRVDKLMIPHFGHHGSKLVFDLLMQIYVFYLNTYEKYG